ncbi:hypothetical protein P3T76_012984 [Phytophthora citrophthora]|uniref:Uncharacterized protein n=1 Tax=Phytophthora citrophthora TaxID=4793 RepID=A0AAD9LCR9_9STRA|nr:hypothetical protein P3T76_012984 [Phytophthora citrophthora]
MNQKESELDLVSFQGLKLIVVPISLFSMENVRRVDLSSNELTRFPGAQVSQKLPWLEVLNLSSNLIHTLEDILALALSPRLCELDVRANPLRLSNNRLYLLETLLFHDVSLDGDSLREIHQDETLKSFTNSFQPVKPMLYKSRLPRCRGFPMLQVLNGDWITDAESRQVEIEHGKPLTYFNTGTKKIKSTCSRKKPSEGRFNVNERRFDGSRMTIKQMLRNEARITAIPPSQVLKRYQIDTESCEEVNEAESPSPNSLTVEDQPIPEEDDHKLYHRLFRSLTSDISEARRTVPDSKAASDLEPWNYPISTFDDLHSDDRQYVRYKSKHVGGTLERDDHFFESSTFLDCVAQCERSRRLTIRAVDLLTQPVSTSTNIPSNLEMSRRTKSVPELPISEASATLTDNLTANFSKRQAIDSFQRVKDFQQRKVTVGDHHIEAEVGDYLLGEHIALRHKINQLISGQTANDIHWRDNAHGIEASLEKSLSRVKLRNAVDLANTLVGAKEQKRLLQALIDADTKVIEEEQVMEEHKAHRQRLRRINSRQVVQPQIRREVELAKKLASLHAESPWQERNWKAKMKLLQHKKGEDMHTVQSSQRGRTNRIKEKQPSIPPPSDSINLSKDAPITQPTAKFRTIETVEKAALDSLAEVNSHDLLVRCSEIRQNKDKHVKALAMHRDRFLEDEAEWNRMRQDPINVVRRHLRRELFQDVQQIQIGNVEYFYSPIFQ